MYAAGAELSEDLGDLGQASWAVSDILEVESPRAQDQELYQSLADAARGSDLEKLLSISDAHLKELNSINAAFALIRAARMVEAERKQDKELKEKPLNPKLLNLIRHVESIVIAATHPRGGSFDRTADPELEDSSSDESKVEDQGLHMAWTLSSISWALGLLGYRNEKLLISLASLVKPVFPHFSPHQLQNCLWAFASLGIKDPGPFFGAAVETIEQRIDDFSNESVVAILTSFAKVKVFNSNLFGAAAEVLAKEGSLTRPQDIANCTWAFATAGHPHPEMFSGLSTFAMQRLQEFQPEQVALLVWAFSYVRCRSEDLFEAVQNHVAERYTQFSPDSLANVLQAFALVGHRGSQVILEAAAEYILDKLKAYSPKALSKVIFTISQTRGYVNLPLQNALAEAFLSSMDGMTASLLTATLMAFSKVKLDDATFFRRAAEKVAPVLADFDSSGFVRLSKVFAQAGIDQSFAQEITEEAMERIPTLRAFELVILTKAMLGMSQASPHLLESLAEHGSSVLPQMSQKELASFIRSLSGLGLTSASSTGEAIFKQAAVKATRHLMTRKEDRRSKTSDLACLSRAFARAAYATGPVADKFQAAGSEPPSELLEVIRDFLKAAVKEAHAHLDEFRASPSCLVGVLWAASQCGVPCDALTQVAKAVLLPPDAGGCDTHVQRLQLLELAELAQALTSLGVDAPELYRAISDKAMQCLQENDAGTKAKAAEEQLVPASELLRFLATAGLLASALARTTSEKVVRMLAEADAGKAKIPAWVIARCIAGLAIAVPAEPVIAALKALAAAAAARVVELFPEERALIFWSLSLHGCYEAIFDSMLEQTPWTVWAAKPKEEFLVSENGIIPSGKLMALCQVHLADLALQLEGRNRKGLSQAQRQHVLEAATLMQRTLSKESFAEADAISQALASMDLVASVGHSSPEGLPLGISVSSPNMRQSRVTIQVDQPGDFLLEIDSSCAHRFPPTTLRRRLLWRLGYTVVVLPWYEVSCCDPEQLRGVLCARLGAVSPPSPSFLSAKGAVSAKVAPRSAIGAIARHGLPDAHAAGREGRLAESQVLTADTGGSGDSQSSSSSAHCSDFEIGGPNRSWQSKQMTRPPGL